MSRRNVWIASLVALPLLFAAAAAASAQAAPAPTININPKQPIAGLNTAVTVTCPAGVLITTNVTITPAGANPATFQTPGPRNPSTVVTTFDTAGDFNVAAECIYFPGTVETAVADVDVTVRAAPDTTPPETTPPNGGTDTTEVFPTTSSAAGAVTVPATAATTSATVAAASGLPPTGSSGTEWAVVAALTVVAFGALAVVGAGAGRRRERQ